MQMHAHAHTQNDTLLQSLHIFSRVHEQWRMTGAFREFNEYMPGKFPLRINVAVREEKKKRERERETERDRV